MWFLEIEDAPVTTANAARNGSIRPLRQDDGAIEVQFRTTMIVDGKRIGRIYMRFVPNQEVE